MAHELTPSTMLSLPRPGLAKPNRSGTFYVLPYSQYDFGKERTTKSVALGKIPRPGVATATGSDHAQPVHHILENVKYLDVAWLDDETVLYLRPKGAQAGKADVDVTLSDKAAKKALDKQEDQEAGQEIWVKELSGAEYKIGKVPLTISDLKIVQSSASTAVLAFSAEVYPEDPSLDAVEKLDAEYEKKLEGAECQVFDKLFIRHWDTWTAPKKKLVFTTELQKDSKEQQDSKKELDELDIQSLSSSEDFECDDATTTHASGHWTLSSTPATPLAGLKNIECPTRPFGGSDEFDVSPSHMVFVAKDPHLPEAWHTRMHCYLVPLHPRNQDEKTPRCLSSQGGARSSPVFSPTARAGHKSSDRASGKIAWLEMRKDGYEADRNRVMIYDLAEDVKYGLTEDWDLSPTSLTWGEDDETLFLIQEENGHKKVFVIPVANNSSPTPSICMTSSHTVSSVAVLPHIFSNDASAATKPDHSSGTRLLLTMNSLVSPNEAYLLAASGDAREPPTLQQLSSITSSLTDKLDMDAGEEFWFAGANPENQVHGFLLKPPGYEKGKKYGLAFLVHGGPQSAWLDSWSTRWNPSCWAAAGYVVVVINPTGSTGYGQQFVDDINQDWGGKPFKDLVAGLQFVKKAYKDLIDPERMIMAGGSYGGYMCNWIQGHNDIMGFKALICHDGILDTKNAYYATEELYFAEHDLGGTPWDVPENYSKWSPANHIRNWKTPELIIHGGLDYRLPDTEAVGMFNALQRKGVPSKLVYFPKENHWVLNPLNSRKWHKEVFAWIDEWIGTGPSE